MQEQKRVLRQRLMEQMESRMQVEDEELRDLIDMEAALFAKRRDYVMVHAGIAIARITSDDQEEAAMIMKDL